METFEICTLLRLCVAQKSFAMAFFALPFRVTQKALRKPFPFAFAYNAKSFASAFDVLLFPFFASVFGRTVKLFHKFIPKTLVTSTRIILLDTLKSVFVKLFI